MKEVSFCHRLFIDIIRFIESVSSEVRVHASFTVRGDEYYSGSSHLGICDYKLILYTQLLEAVAVDLSVLVVSDFSGKRCAYSKRRERDNGIWARSSTRV